MDRPSTQRERSITVDLAPNGACPFACDYCNSRRRGRDGLWGSSPAKARTFPQPVNMRALEEHLRKAFDRARGRVGAVLFAGSGECTASPQFEEALTVALACVKCLARRPVPVRVLTCGTTLERPNVGRMVEDLVRSGDGEVWLKLDAWDEESFQRINGATGYAQSVRRILALARRVPVVLSTTVARRKGDEGPGALAAYLARAVRALVDERGFVERVELTTVRSPPDGEGPCALPGDDLAAVAAAISDVLPGRVALGPARS